MSHQLSILYCTVVHMFRKSGNHDTKPIALRNLFPFLALGLKLLHAVSKVNVLDVFVMRKNWCTKIVGTKVVLVPYRKAHVEK